MDIYFEIFNNMLHTTLPESDGDATQKWIKLSLLKSYLRYGLLSFENSIGNLPFEDRERIWYQYLILKDCLWQAVGAIHGIIASATVSSVVEVNLYSIGQYLS